MRYLVRMDQQALSPVDFGDLFGLGLERNLEHLVRIQLEGTEDALDLNFLPEGGLLLAQVLGKLGWVRLRLLRCNAG